MTRRTKFNLSLIVFGLITLLGVVTFIFQVSSGLGVTGMNNVFSWALYITMFVFFVGLSAGGLIVSSSATVFNIPSFKKVAKPATILSTVCIILAVLFIFVDLGRPFRILNLIIHPQFKSPLIWDVIVIPLYLVINIIYLYLMTRKKTNEKMLKITSFFALPIAILVHSVTAWIFGLQIAREGWFSELMSPLFVASALDSGLALLLIVLVLLKQFKAFSVDKDLITKLAGLLVIFVIVDAYLVLAEVLTMIYPQKESTMQVLNHMFTGTMAPFFWGEVILGFIIPIGILLFKKNREKISLVVTSSILVILGVFGKRVWLVLTSFKFPNFMGSPGVTTGHYAEGQAQTIHDSTWTFVGQYMPTLPELTIVVGLLALGVVMFMILSRFILRSPRKDAAIQK